MNTPAADTGVIGENRPAPKVETKTKKILKKPGKAALGVAEDQDIDPLLLSTPEAVSNVIRDLTGKDSHPRIHVFETEAELIAAIENGDVPAADIDQIKASQPYGYVAKDANGEAHAHFITSRIPAGGELSAFMHEVGSHIGLSRG